MNISYSNPVLREFEREIQPFKEGKHNALDVYKFLHHKRIGIRSDTGDFVLFESKTREYEDVMEKLRQLSHLQNRTTAAKAHEAEELTTLYE